MVYGVIMRKILLSPFTRALVGCMAHPAFADIERMKNKLAGECYTPSADKCTINGRATGTDLFDTSSSASVN